MVALCNRADHYIFMMFLLSFFPRSVVFQCDRFQSKHIAVLLFTYELATDTAT